jgi:hypothetical protein
LEKKAFCQKVEVYDSCPSNDIKIVLGGWNAKVGREEIYQGLIDKHSMHLNTNNNNNKQRLVDFAPAKYMVVSLTCFSHKEIHKQTWRSLDGKTNNQTDHILIHKSSMMDVKLCRGANSDSEHYLVRGKYRSYEPNRTRRLHVDAVQEASMVRRFQQQLE